MIVSGDFETHYTKDYSLNKLSEVEYILDPRFEVIMLALKINDGPSVVHVGEPAIRQALDALDFSRVAWLSHNTRFDGSILAWRFNKSPQLYLDTLSMARAVSHWEIGRSSLKAVSEWAELPPKGDEVGRAIGKRLVDFDPDSLRRYMSYCARDNDNCYDIYLQLKPLFSPYELQLIDIILRMFIRPQVKLDVGILEEHLTEVKAEKARALVEVAGIDKEWFSSNQKFAQLLRHYGVVVPTKKSPATGEQIPALARNDWAFKELCMDENLSPTVQAILATRQSVKSTIDQTRAEAFLKLSQVQWPTQGERWAPVPLKFSGARTHRLSGDGGINFQNLRRGSMLREALVAPEGYRIVHRDSSQIEARMVAWLAKETILLKAFRKKQDVYCDFATIIYGREITPVDRLERHVGKTAILGLGYGCGGIKFRHMLYTSQIPVLLDENEAAGIVALYRDTYPNIRGLWGLCSEMLRYMMTGNDIELSSRYKDIKHIPVHAKEEYIWLPNGLAMHYPKLSRGKEKGEEKEICYNDPYGGRRRIYGAKVVENISQALARIVVTDIVLRMYQLTGYHPWLSTHDSLDYCVPAEDAEWMDAELERQFAIRPSWAKTLPLASEGGWGISLADAERKANL